MPPLQASYRYHPHPSRTNLDTTYSCNNSDTTSHTSVLAFSGKEILRVLQSRGQAVCLIAGLQEKIIYKSALFPSGGGGARDALQKKATRKATSEVVQSRLAGHSQA